MRRLRMLAARSGPEEGYIREPLTGFGIDLALINALPLRAVPSRCEIHRSVLVEEQIRINAGMIDKDRV
ncbi:hypothetical protein D3C85_1933110 [compost metagenome]